MFHTFRIVVAERQRQVLDRFGDAPIDPRRPDEPIVDRKERMIATQGDAIAARGRPRQLQSRGRHGRAVLSKLAHLGTRDHPQQFLGAIHFDFGRAGEIRAMFHLGRGSCHDGFKRMAQGDRATTHAVLDELVAIDIPDMAALTTLDEAG